MELHTVNVSPPNPVDEITNLLNFTCTLTFILQSIKQYSLLLCKFSRSLGCFFFPHPPCFAGRYAARHSVLDCECVQCVSGASAWFIKNGNYRNTPRTEVNYLARREKKRAQITLNIDDFERNVCPLHLGVLVKFAQRIYWGKHWMCMQW